MNEFLAQYFGTNAPADAAPSNEKVAEAELFAKLAAENGIDLNTMSDDQIQELYAATFKTASEEEDKTASDDKDADDKKEDDDKDEKKAAAAAELASMTEETTLAQEKFAEATLMGQIMAHSMMRELQAIKEAADAHVVSKGMKFIESGKAKGFGDKAKELAEKVKGSKLVSGLTGSGAKKTKAELEAARAGAKAMGQSEESGERLRRAFQAHKSESSRVMKHRIGAGVAAAGAAGAAGGAASRKEASALLELASEEAVKMAAAGGFDIDEAAERVTAVLTLTGGTFDNTKVASVGNDVDAAVGVRALELLEAAGYPVEWKA